MTETQPYITRTPGDPVTAGDWNDLQVQVKDDIAAQIAAAKTDIVATGVQHADDADQFARRSDTQWLSELDKRYAPIGHVHEGPSAYRRYLKHFSTDPGLNEVLLEHHLGAFPLIDIYELTPISGDKDNPGPFSLFFYYGHVDEEKYGLSVRVGRERARLGLHLERLLAELSVAYDDDSSIGDVVNDMWDALRQDPNDELAHGTSPWIDQCCGEARTVAELKRTQQWNDLYLGIKPVKVTLLHGSGTPQAGVFDVTAVQANYDTVYLKVDGFGKDQAGNDREQADLMILLRS
jgi:hypothetical protein